MFFRTRPAVPSSEQAVSLSPEKDTCHALLFASLTIQEAELSRTLTAPVGSVQKKKLRHREVKLFAQDHRALVEKGVGPGRP